MKTVQSLLITTLAISVLSGCAVTLPFNNRLSYPTYQELQKEAVDKIRIETSLNKEIFRLGEACDYLRCDRSTLRKFINTLNTASFPAKSFA